MKDEDVFRRLFDGDEEILWSQKPILRRCISNREKIFFVVAFILLNLMFVLTFIALGSWKDFMYYYQELFFVFLIVCIAMSLVVAFIYVLYFFQEYVGLKRTKYFITNRRILVVREIYNNKISKKHKKHLTNHPLSEIKGYNFKIRKNHLRQIYDLRFLIKHTSEESYLKSILVCTNLLDISLGEKYRVQIREYRDHGGENREYLLRLGNVQEREKISEILNGVLGLEMIDKFENEKKLGVLSTHQPFE